MYATLLGFMLAGQPAADVKQLVTPAQAQAYALGDLRQQAKDQQPFIRYVWVGSGKPNDLKTASLTMNYVSQNALVIKPVALIGGPLLRVNLQHYANSPDDLALLLTLWEEFQYDPSFATLLTKGSLKQILLDNGVIEIGKKGILIPCAPYVVGGETYDAKWVNVLRLPGLHLDKATDAELQQRTGSLAPIVEANYFMFRALGTIKDKGVYQTIFGGLYYELSGLKTSKDKNVTDEDLFFEQQGIGDTKKGVKAKDIYERVQSDRRAAMFKSRVTGKPRTVDFLKSVNGKDEAFIMVTHDTADEDIDIDTHPVMNLVNFKDKAREVIYTRRNGLHGFVLFDGNGKLQEAAPDNIVKDHEVPAKAGTARLQGAISCIRCHGVDGSDGIKPVANDVLTMTKGGRVDIFGDITELDKSIQETVNRLAGQYAASPEKTVRRGREDYIQAILEAGGPWKEGKDQTEVGQLSAKQFAKAWDDYWYTPVDAQQACRELGWDVPPQKAKAAINLLLPPVVADRVGDKVPEDPRLAALKAGIPIPRSDWALAYSFAAARAKQTEAKFQRGASK